MPWENLTEDILEEFERFALRAHLVDDILNERAAYRRARLREAWKVWAATPKGKAWLRAYRRGYRKTEAYKASTKRTEHAVVGACTCVRCGKSFPLTRQRRRMGQTKVCSAKCRAKPPWKTITLRGETRTYREWARRIGITETLLRYRVRAGWPEARIFSPRGAVEPVRRAA